MKIISFDGNTFVFMIDCGGGIKGSFIMTVSECSDYERFKSMMLGLFAYYIQARTLEENIEEVYNEIKHMIKCKAFL